MFYGSLTKIAADTPGIMDLYNAGRQGANIANNGRFFMNPIDTIKGAYKGIVGHIGNLETQKLQQQGIAFNKDEYGRIQDVNIGNTIKGVGGNMLNKLDDWLPNVPSGNGMLGQAGNWINQNKGLLLGGLGAAAGGYLLKNMFFPSTPRPRYSVPRPYTQGYVMPQPMAPQSFAKFGSLGFMPSVFSAPELVGSAVTGNLQLPSYLSGPDNNGDGVPDAAQPTTYAPKITSQNPRLKALLQDPNMRAYVTDLVKSAK